MKDFEQRARCDRTFTVDVYCRSYVIEIRGFGRVSEEEKRESKALLDFLMGMFESNINSQVRETILDVCTYYDDVFPYPRHRETDMSVFAIQRYVEDCLGRWVWSGEITIHRDDDRWWERLLPIEETKPPRRKPPRVVPPKLEPALPVDKTWFSAQFVDESGLWIDGLSVTLKVGGTSHALTTDKAGVVELRQQTETMAKVWVAEIAQAEKMLVERLERMDEAPAPTGPDVVELSGAWSPLRTGVFGSGDSEADCVGASVVDRHRAQGPGQQPGGGCGLERDLVGRHGLQRNVEPRTGRLGLSRDCRRVECELSFPELDAREWGATTEFNPEGETYVVQQGDHISAIAERAGFETDDSIWMHPKNAKLRAKRDNPHVLREGDELFVPTKRAMTVKRATRAMHDFVLQRTPLTRSRARARYLRRSRREHFRNPFEYAGTKKEGHDGR